MTFLALPTDPTVVSRQFLALPGSEEPLRLPHQMIPSGIEFAAEELARREALRPGTRVLVRRQGVTEVSEELNAFSHSGDRLYRGTDVRTGKTVQFSEHNVLRTWR